MYDLIVRHGALAFLDIPLGGMVSLRGEEDDKFDVVSFFGNTSATPVYLILFARR